MNRKERRAQASQSRHADSRNPNKFAFMIDDDHREHLKEVVRDPAWKRLCYALARELCRWQELNPEKTPEWRPEDNILYTGSLENPEARDFIALNEAAHEALVFADEQTGHEGTVMMAGFAARLIFEPWRKNWLEKRHG